LVEKIYFKEGDYVKKGQTILKLNDKLQKLETNRRKLVLDDTTNLDSLEINLETMKDIVEKKEYLYENTKAVSLNELRQLKMQYVKNRGELLSLRENEKKEKVEYQISSEVLDYYKLKSPISGTIITIIPNLGEWVQTGKIIVNIVDIKTCFVEVDLEQNAVSQLLKNKNVKIEVNGKDSLIIKDGYVDFISSVADSSSGLTRAKISFKNKDGAVTPGVSATIKF